MCSIVRCQSSFLGKKKVLITCNETLADTPQSFWNWAFVYINNPFLWQAKASPSQKIFGLYFQFCHVAVVVISTMATKLKGIYKSFKYITQIFGNLLCTLLCNITFLGFVVVAKLGSGYCSSCEGAGDGNWVPDRC